MRHSDIKKEEENFLKTLHKLQVDIATLFYKIARHISYDDEETKDLFKVYKYKEGLAITKDEKPG